MLHEKKLVFKFLFHIFIQPESSRLDQVLTVYSGVKVVPNLMVACKKLARQVDLEEAQVQFDF